MSSGWFDCTEPSQTTSFQGKQVCWVLMHWFGVVQVYRTSSNLLEPHHHRDSKVCRVLAHEFRLCRTFSNFNCTGEARCAGCFCTSSGWFKYIEPPRTLSNHIITERARCVEFCHMSAGWFDCAKPSRT